MISKKSIAAGAFVIFGITLALYFEVQSFGFLNFDDDLYVYNNPRITGGPTLSNIHWAFTSSLGGHWHPLSWISHMIDCKFFGLNPGPMHLENAVLHAVNAVLVFLMVLAVVPNVSIAVAGSLLFAVHPLRIESVAWISERKDVLSNLFGLSSIIFYLRYKDRKTWKYILLSLLFFASSLLSKPTYMTLPLLLLVLDYHSNQKLDKEALLSKWPFFLISFLSGVAALHSQNLDGGLKGSDVVTLSDRFSMIWLGYLTYIGKMIAPLGIGIFYPLRRYDFATGLGALLCFAGLTVLVYIFRRKHKGLYLCFCWYLVALLPVIGIFPIGGQSYADRWTYLPAVGISLGIASEASSYGRRAMLSILFLSSIAYAVITYINLPNWKDSVSIFSHTLKVAPDNFMAHTNLGAVYDSQGKVHLAAPHFEEAARLNPTYPEALNNLGRIRANAGKLSEAEALFRKALNIRPSFTLARYNLGLTLTNLNRAGEGMKEWLEIISKEPEEERTLGSLRYMLSNRKDEVCRAYQSSDGFSQAFRHLENRYPDHFVSVGIKSLMRSCAL